MKALVLFFSLSLPLAAAAQKYQKFTTQEVPKTYVVGKEKAPLYRNAADTTGAPRLYVSPGWEVTVVGDFTPHWAIVKREGFQFITPAKKLADYGPEIPSDVLKSLPIDPETKLITYQGVVEAPGVSKAELYIRAYSWVAKAYKSANAVIQMQDKDAGQLIVKGLNKIGIDDGVVRHTLSIYVKDGRYKYILTDLNHDAAGAPGLYSGGPLEQPTTIVSQLGNRARNRTEWSYIQTMADLDARRLVRELQAAMTLKGAKDPSDF